MRDYGKVYTRFWESDDIRSLSDDGRMLALYLMTCPHGTIAGVFRLPDGYVCEDMKWDAARVAAAFVELHRKGFANRCETTKWVWVAKHLEWNPPENPNQRKSAAKVALSIAPGTSWIAEFMRVCGVLLDLPQAPDANPLPTVPRPLANQEQKQYQEQKQEHSVPIGTGGKPPPSTPPDPVKQEIWDAGRSLLTASRMPSKQVGTFLGKLVQDYGAAIVLDAVRAAVKEQPADAAEYLKAACMRAKGERIAPNKQEALEQRNRNVAHAWAGEDHAGQ